MLAWLLRSCRARVGTFSYERWRITWQGLSLAKARMHPASRQTALFPELTGDPEQYLWATEEAAIKFQTHTHTHQPRRLPSRRAHAKRSHPRDERLGAEGIRQTQGSTQ